MLAYIFDNVESDQRLPHIIEPPLLISEAELKELGVLYWRADDPEIVESVAKERGYKNRDTINVSREGLGDLYESKIKGFFEEHMHEDEEIRYILDGSGFFDVRRTTDEAWVRIAVEKGDLLVIPAGIYHRFTLDTKDYIKALRLFQDEPKWVPHNRSAETELQCIFYKKSAAKPPEIHYRTATPLAHQLASGVLKYHVNPREDFFPGTFCQLDDHSSHIFAPMPSASIYKSAYPDRIIPRESVFSKLFPKNPEFDEDLPAFIDAVTGLKCSPANSAYTPSELAHQISDSGSGFVLVHPALLETLLKALELLKVAAADVRKRVILMNFDGPTPKGAGGYKQLDSLLVSGKLNEEEKLDGELSDETVYLCYSSGTTGLSKGVETSHHNTNAVIAMSRAAFPEMIQGRDVLLGILPFFHSYGAMHLIQYPLTLAVPVVISPAFNPETFCASIQRFKITCALVVPPVLVVLASHPVVDKYDFSSLRFLFCGAAPLRAELIASVQSRLRGRGAEVLVPQGCGLTEMSPTVLLTPLHRATEKIGSAGELLPNLEARLVGEDGLDVELGQPGELWLRGPSVMKGYLNNPTATRNAITPDGWFKTGDVVIRDKDGFYTIIDRLKELIKYKGSQVPPADLENVLLSHPDIIDAGVIGIESVEQATELPSRAYIVHRAGHDSFSSSEKRHAFESGVQSWIQSRVAKHKYLRGGVTLIESIPKSPSGKILRRELRKYAQTELANETSKSKL
ncbi:acetyl-CoA synthetase, partial [Rhizoctonia solani]